MKKLLILTLLVVIALAGCKGEKSADAVKFTVYPGARYLPELTDLFRRAGSVVSKDPVPPQVLYDTDAKIEEVAQFYAKENGYSQVWPDQTGNMSAVAPPAYYRTGDLGTDAQGIAPVLQKLNMNVDVTKAQGKYRGAHISGGPEHPRISLERPYFDPLKQQVVDRTLIVMVKEH